MFSFLGKDIFLKISLGFLVTPMIMIFLVVIGIREVNQIKSSLQTINKVTSVKQRYAINFRGSVHDRAIALRDVVLFKDKKNVDLALKDITDLDEFYQISAKKMATIFETQKVNEEEKQLLAKIMTSEKVTMPLILKTIQAKNNSQFERAHTILTKQAKQEFTLWLKRINDFINYQEARNKIDAATATSVANNFEYLMVVLTGISLIIAALLGFFITRSAAKPLMQVTCKLDRSSNKITNISDSISASNNSLSSGSQQQSVAINNINSAVEQMNITVSDNMTNSDYTAEVSNEGKESADAGKTIVLNMIESISEINESNNQVMNQVNEGNDEIRKIVDVIKEISLKTNVINEIVFQTKLLSFNASVEAARAGEHGKGFSVVAKEIGNLAKLSGNAVKETSEMLDNSINKVDAIVSTSTTKVEVLVEEAKSKVSIANEVSQKCSDVLEQIVSKVSLATTASLNISNASKEQKDGFNEIADSIQGMNQIVQQNTESFVENSKTIQSLNHQSDELREAYASLSKLIGA